MGNIQIVLTVLDIYKRLKKPLSFIFRLILKKNLRKKETNALNGTVEIKSIEVKEKKTKKIFARKYIKIDIIRYLKNAKRWLKIGFGLKNILLNLRLRMFIKNRR